MFISIPCIRLKSSDEVVDVVQQIKNEDYEPFEPLINLNRIESIYNHGSLIDITVIDMVSGEYFLTKIPKKQIQEFIRKSNPFFYSLN